MKKKTPRLRESQVLSIKQEWKSWRDTLRLAKKHKVTKRCIQMIVSGQRWGWLKK